MNGEKMMPAQSPSQYAWHAFTIHEVFNILNTQSDGLSIDAAKNRLEIYGLNVLKPPKKNNLIIRFFAQFNHILIYVLMASAFAALMLKHWIDMSVILGVVIINAVIGVIQEGKAERALDAIRHMLSLKATVIRDGERMIIPAESLVPGDIVLLKSGNKVPADLRVLDSKNLQIQEDILTGESLPVEKSISPIPVHAELGGRSCMAYSGTLVTYGKGMGIVVATGENTEVGRIGAMLAELPLMTTPLLRQMNVFSRWLTIAILIIAVFTFLFGLYFRDYGMSTMFMAAVGLAVAAIPEGLPAIITITLAIGVTRMAERHAIIRRLPAVETLGSITVICTDKTGTLTMNEIAVQDIITSEHRFIVTGTGYSDAGDFKLDSTSIDPDKFSVLKQIINAAILCNDAALIRKDEKWHLHGNPVDGALLSLGLKAKRDLHFEKQSYPLVDLIPFESEHKFMATLHHDHMGNDYLYVKGAPERIISMCSSQLSNNQIVPIDKNYWRKEIELLANQGRRVLGIAMRLTAAKKNDLRFSDVEGGLTMLALLGLLDQPRKEAFTAVSECHSAGIRVIMITGDHAATAKAVARQVGIENCENALDGRELDALSIDELAAIIDQFNIYARTSPEHKLKLVEALQNRGHIVAMTGDGINDTPALKRADVGIAMGKKGTEAAKETAEIILTDDNFASIISAIKEGRTIYNNLRKTILYILPTNGGETLVIMTAIFLGWILPITPVQILWVNMITAITLSLSLAFEPAEKNVMKRPPRKTDKPILSPLLVWRSMFVSFLMLIGSFGLFLLARESQIAIDTARTITVNTLVMGEIAYLLNSRRILGSVFNWEGFFGSIPVIVAIGIILIFQIFFTYAPWMQKLFGTSAIDSIYWLYIAVFGICLFLLVELEKGLIRLLNP
ncbi:putative cation-transporting ATPase F [Aquicella siphonis]|uniref:Putative cation-transporting ATPase F n=1 Tax=Aquicella siphonis TaxID=254247 RepID=A0A5E4PKQ5_9COXI|nr:cation-transporting P-type ATPase [Aquicella siphonis]VVC77138.1 putative cation-transporting ATPase F [Aquicella siphonis]